MTQIDFYIINENLHQDRYFLTCRLADKAWKASHQVLIQTSNEQEAKHIDHLLWTFKEQSFVPHDLGMTDYHSPIKISWSEPDIEDHDILINLATEIPDIFCRFQRVIEPVDNHPEHRLVSREHYRYYRDRGYPLSTKEISS